MAAHSSGVAPAAASEAALADATRLGAVELNVPDLDRSIAWYQDALGLRLHRREDQSAALGAGGDDLLVLHEQPSARPAGRHAGLYHYALLYPTREELARAAVRLAVTRTPIQGASDHGTHEAIYLPDADGIGIELAWDRARELWPDLRYMSGPAPLDLDGLLATVAGEEPARHAAPGVKVGHVHLHVSEVDPSTRFYRDGLGFEVVTDLGSAVFVSAGGYHHHVAYNVWMGRGVPAVPPDTVGLRHWTLVLADTGELAALRQRLTEIGAAAQDAAGGLLARDPSGIAVLAVVDTAGDAPVDAAGGAPVDAAGDAPERA